MPHVTRLGSQLVLDALIEEHPWFKDLMKGRRPHHTVKEYLANPNSMTINLRDHIILLCEHTLNHYVQAHALCRLAEENQSRMDELQRRIFTTLTYRHLMGKLSAHPQNEIREDDRRRHPNSRFPGSQTCHPSDEQKSGDSFQNWIIFWNKNWDKARAQVASTGPLTEDPRHLFRLARRFNPRGQDQVYAIGKNVYGQLSSNIHEFHGEFKFDLDQWDPTIRYLFEELTPLNENIDNSNGVDWEKERARYL
jgi:hypothetical protein